MNDMCDCCLGIPTDGLYYGCVKICRGCAVSAYRQWYDDNGNLIDDKIEPCYMLPSDSQLEIDHQICRNGDLYDEYYLTFPCGCVVSLLTDDPYSMEYDNLCSLHLKVLEKLKIEESK